MACVVVCLFVWLVGWLVGVAIFYAREVFENTLQLFSSGGIR